MIEPSSTKPINRGQPLKDRHPQGFVAAPRGTAGNELIKANKNAFVLLYIIAQRSQRTGKLNRFNLRPGEALIGDFEHYEMTEQEYRTAKQVLKKFNLATFESTGRGTIATLINTEIFDANIEGGNGQDDRQPTDSQRTANDFQECLEAKRQRKKADFGGGKGALSGEGEPPIHVPEY